MEKTRDRHPYEYDAESLSLSTDGETRTITPALIAVVARPDENEDIESVSSVTAPTACFSNADTEIVDDWLRSLSFAWNQLI